MKKFTLLIILSTLVGACTSKEQDEKIHAFWAEQMGGVVQSALLRGKVSRSAQSFQPGNTFSQEETTRGFAPITQDNTDPANLAEFEQMAEQWQQAQQSLPTDSANTGVQPFDTTSSQTAQNPATNPTAQGQLTEAALKTQPVQVSTQTAAAPVKSSTTAAAATRAVRKPKESTQYMEITMEESFTGQAPAADLEAIERSFEKVQQDNSKALQDIGAIFGENTQSQAFAITSKTERALRRAAKTSSSLQEYLKTQRKLLKQQETDLNSLMQKNANNLRSIRG